ncbi:MAG: nucleotide pyrophosphohydrolase [Pseudomonadaceae bacterium]|nr:nucleotide pyrophosphohydrolase [Pseudomonadaceae bacterium]
MTLRAWQDEVDDWIGRMGGYFSPLSQLAQLTEEVGELARLINRVHGDQSFKKGEKDEAAIPDEMADILFTLTCLANSLKVDLTDAAKANMAKKTQRDAARHAGNSKLGGASA